MRFFWFLGKIGILLVACTAVAAPDSIELRNGRHLQGKYVGGTATVVGFMTGSTIEYFSISDVLALIFDRSLDSPLSGVRPDPMNEHSPQTLHENSRQACVGARTKMRSTEPRLEQVKLVDYPCYLMK